MRILMSTSSYTPTMNGQTVFTTNLAEGLVRMGHEVMVAVDSSQRRATTTQRNGVRIEQLPSVDLGIFHQGVHFSPFPGRDIERLVDLFQPHVVHIQDHYPSCRAAIKAARRRGIRIVGSNHFIPENIAPYIPLLPRFTRLYGWIAWRWVLDAYKHADVVTAQSKAAARIMEAAGFKPPIYTISCGIDTWRFYPDRKIERGVYRRRYGLDLNKIIFLFLGRIDGEKCIHLLLQAAAKLTRPDIQIAIAGRGKVEDELKALAASLGLGSKVVFTGFIPEEDICGLMNSVDVFIMPSEAELLSISTLEAMACGRPVLLADALALPELVLPGENGFLFQPGSVDDLAQKMLRLAGMKAQWPSMGAISRRIATAHSLDETLRRFDELYCQLMEEGTVAEIEREPTLA